MTEFQQAIADGVESIATSQAGSWLFGSAAFVASSSPLKPNDPRMIGASNRLIEIRIRDVDLPSPYPRKGDEVSRAGKIYRITETHPDLVHGITILLASIP